MTDDPDVMSFDYTPPQGNAIQQVEEAVAEAQFTPAGPLDDLQQIRQEETVAETQAEDAAKEAAEDHAKDRKNSLQIREDFEF